MRHEVNEPGERRDLSAGFIERTTAKDPFEGKRDDR
jgi:hypothetical protein